MTVILFLFSLVLTFGCGRYYAYSRVRWYINKVNNRTQQMYDKRYSEEVSPFLLEGRTDAVMELMRLMNK